METPLNQLTSKIKTLPIYKTHKINLSQPFLQRFLNTAKNDIPKAISRYENYYNILLSLPLSNEICNRNEKVYKNLITDIEKNLKISQEKFGKDCYPATYYGKTPKIPKSLILGLEIKTAVELMDPTEKSKSGENGEISKNKFCESSIYGMICFFNAIQEFHDPEAEANIVLIEDQSGFNLKASKVILNNRWFIKSFTSLMSNALPMRIETIYMVNAPFIFKTVFNVIKVFLSEKIKSRIKFTGDSDHSSIIEQVGGVEFMPDNLKGGSKKYEPIEFDLEERLLSIFPEKILE